MERKPHAVSWLIGRASLCVALLVVISCVAPSAGSTANPAKVGYDVTVIGDFSAPLPPGGLPSTPQGSGALGINGAGDVVGWSYYFATDSSVYAFLYVNRTGELLKLRALPPDGWDSYGEAVNDSGVVVGGATTFGPYPYYPFSWQHGVMTNLLASDPDCLDALYLCQGFAYDINSTGDIVGVKFTPDPRGSFAFLYSNGTFTDLVLPGDSSSSATAINDRGDIVGWSDPSGAFLYRGGTMTGLAALGCSGCSPTDISENRKVVGSTTLGSGERHAFLWADGVMQDLGTLGGSFSEATAVTKAGNTVVGNSTTTSGESHGFVYRGGKMVDLNELIEPGIGTIVSAQDVNDSGQIAGDISVLRTIGGYDRYVTYAMLLTPRK